VKLSVFHIFRVSSIFRPEKRVKKPQGTHILDRLEILYRMVYDFGKTIFFTLFLLCVHLTIVQHHHQLGRESLLICRYRSIMNLTLLPTVIQSQAK
jgi:hypothetical protein